MFAILVTPLNEDHNSVTLNILQGDLQEHRNMPLEDAISMIAHIFEKGLNNTDQSQGNVAKWVMFLHIWVKISASLSYLEKSELKSGSMYLDWLNLTHICPARDIKIEFSNPPILQFLNLKFCKMPLK